MSLEVYKVQVRLSYCIFVILYFLDILWVLAVKLQFRTSTSFFEPGHFYGPEKPTHVSFSSFFYFLACLKNPRVYIFWMICRCLYLIHDPIRTVTSLQIFQGTHNQILKKKTFSWCSCESRDRKKMPNVPYKTQVKHCIMPLQN